MSNEKGRRSLLDTLFVVVLGIMPIPLTILLFLFVGLPMLIFFGNRINVDSTTGFVILGVLAVAEFFFWGWFAKK